MTGHRDPRAVSAQPLQRLTIRHASGAQVRVSYQASPETARDLATTYKRAIGWPDATIEEGHDASSI